MAIEGLASSMAMFASGWVERDGFGGEEDTFRMIRAASGADSSE